jgi:hypothetical protein
MKGNFSSERFVGERKKSRSFDFNLFFRIQIPSFLALSPLSNQHQPQPFCFFCRFLWHASDDGLPFFSIIESSIAYISLNTYQH